MSSSCDASILWTDIAGRSYKRSSGIKSIFVKLSSWYVLVNVVNMIDLGHKFYIVVIFLARLESSCISNCMQNNV